MDNFAVKPHEQIKVIQTNFNSMDITGSTGQIAINLCPIQGGDALYQRNGTGVTLCSIHLRGLIEPQQANSATAQNSLPDYIRLVVFYDKAPSGTTPVWSDVVQNVVSGSSQPNDPPNYNNRNRFLILRDMTFLTPQYATSSVTLGTMVYVAGAQGPCPIPTMNEMKIDFYKNFHRKLQQVYLGIGGTTASLNTGGLFMVYQKFAAAQSWEFTINSEVCFVDH